MLLDSDPILNRLTTDSRSGPPVGTIRLCLRNMSIGMDDSMGNVPLYT